MLHIAKLGKFPSFMSQFPTLPPTALDDLEIIARVQNGQRELFGELHRRHHDKVLRFIQNSVWERESAQDLASEAWIRAYNAVDRFEPRESKSVVGWLMRICANLITDYRRKLGPETQAFEEEDEYTLPQFIVAGTERDFWAREQFKAIREAFCQLSPGDQKIIFLAHGQERTSAEIAEILGKPSASAVTSHLHRAMGSLRTKITQSGWE